MVSDSDWEDLLDSIDAGRVLPVLGWGITTFGVDDRLLGPWLAREYARRLRVDSGTLPESFGLNDVMRLYLMNGGRRNDAAVRFSDAVAMQDAGGQGGPGSSLRALASIGSLRLFLTLTPDSLLQQALDEVRHERRAATRVRQFSLQDKCEDLGASLEEVAAEPSNSWVYHVLGRAGRALGSCVIWDEDLLEFLLELNSSMARGQLSKLCRDLQPDGNVELLAIGVSFSDWVMRFFLRVMRQTRLTDEQPVTRLVESGGIDPGNLVFLCGRQANGLQLFDMSPGQFARDLAVRWRERHPEEEDASAASAIVVPNELPDCAVFVSYMREDQAAVARVVSQLQSYGCEVWLDTERLKSGMNFDLRIEQYITSRRIFFVSVISEQTESSSNAYAHKERAWAAERALSIPEVDREEFYFPIIISDSVDPGRVQKEPRIFAGVHRERASGGAVSAAFCQRLKLLQDRSRRGPRGEQPEDGP